MFCQTGLAGRNIRTLLWAPAKMETCTSWIAITSVTIIRKTIIRSFKL